MFSGQSRAICRGRQKPVDTTKLEDNYMAFLLTLVAGLIFISIVRRRPRCCKAIP